MAVRRIPDDQAKGRASHLPGGTLSDGTAEGGGAIRTRVVDDAIKANGT